MSTRTRPFLILLCLAALYPLAARAAEEIEILRDPWGIPHIFADTDAGAFQGLGYATAEDRGFQMTYALRIVQGRLAEVIGDVRKLNRGETALDNDKKMRTFGFYRAAQRVAPQLDSETQGILEAYCKGVNAYFDSHRDSLHPMFAQLGLKPEPWTPADCIASWWHLGQFFATDGTRDLIAGRNNSEDRNAAARGRGMEMPALPEGMEPLPPDEGPAVIKRGDVAPAWVEALDAYAAGHGLRPRGGTEEGPKFSHAWVAGGKRTTTGAAVLVSDPQTPVRNPALFHEFHIQGATFNARGIGVPGSPALLIGFTDHVAWGVTALGADQADLFQLETNPDHPDAYRFNGEWRPMTVHNETIRVKDGEPVFFTVRETHLGPVATAYCFARPEEGEVALKRIPICEEDRETAEAVLGMFRAKNANEFDATLEDWRFPSANCVFGDTQGDIGYRTIAAIPVRSAQAPGGGRGAMPGHTDAQDWQGIVPHALMPHVLNPACGYTYSANHRPIESWYPIPLATSTGSGGDTVRSWRLRERLKAKDRFKPEEVLAIHHDAVNPARRDIVRLALHLRNDLERPLSPDARKAIEILEPWYEAGASSALSQPGAETAAEINTFFRFVNTPLALLYGGGESGLAYFLKSATARIENDPSAAMLPMEEQFVDKALSGAWQSARGKYTGEPETWTAQARRDVQRRSLGYQESLDGFPALDPALNLPFPALAVVDGGTIASQAAQSYTQYVPMHDPDQAQTILPIGQSDWPEAESRTSTLGLWGEGKLHPAPLSREKVEALGCNKTVLDI